MPDDAIRHVFNDRTANMSITVLNLTEASTLLRTINRRDIKDVRAIDLDLALVLENGHKIIISRGAVAAVNSPQLVLEFADGDVILGEVFEKLNHIEVPPDAAALGQSAVVQGLKLGWYWAAQSSGDILGGNGNDEIALGSTRSSTATFVQTGAGQDKIIVGSYGRTENLAATVSDFTVGVDKVEVFNQTLTQANLSSFVRASAGANPNDTRLVIDLDGAGPGTLTYTLMLQNVVYNNLNTASIFGL